MSRREVSTASEQAMRFFAAAAARGFAVALWRQPGAESMQGIAASHAQTLGQPRFDSRQAGFVFAPFAEERPTLFIPDHYRLDGDGLHTAPGLPPLDLDIHLDAVPWAVAPVSADQALDAAAFAGLVAEAVAFIRSAQIAKVVVSRTAAVALPPSFAPTRLFNVLCRHHPNAFVSLVSIPRVGTWLGASPELLLRVDADELSTVALAGTQKRVASAPLQSVVWGEKENAEQEMVSTYIRSVFHDAGAVDVTERGPQTIAAGGVVHLQTRFSVRRRESALLPLANELLARLHPTSAVCGMPRNEALQFIHSREGYDRGFYSGYLGPLNIGGRSTLYVNLRCMQVRAHSAALYVGAGVTAASNPAAEWAETELKTHTILDALAETSAAAAADAPVLGSLTPATA